MPFNQMLSRLRLAEALLILLSLKISLKRDWREQIAIINEHMRAWLPCHSAVIITPD